METENEIVSECPQSLKYRRTHENALIQDIPESNRISLVSYNILADCHVQRAHYADYTEPNYLDIDTRHKVVMEELEYLKGDVVCLQEVGTKYFEQTMKPDMKKLGYEGSYTKRTSAFYDEGCVTFFLSSKFVLLSHNVYDLGKEADEVFRLKDHEESMQKKLTLRYINRADILLVTKLQSKLSGHTLIICNTHLVWDSLFVPDVRCLQMFIVMNILDSYVSEDTDSYVICGDFNSEPESTTYKMATVKTNLSDEGLSVLKKSMDNTDTVSILSDTIRRKPDTISLESSYVSVMKAEPEVTNVDDTYEVCLDYIFFGNKEKQQDSQIPVSVLVPVSVLDCPPLPEIKKFLPPSKVYPSDHLPIKTTFAIVHRKAR